MFRLVLFIVALCLCATAAIAGEVAAIAGLDPLGDAVVQVFRDSVMPIIVSFVLTLLGVLLDQLRKRTGVKLSQEREEQLKEWARQGVAIAEEKAAAFLRKNSAKIPGNEKVHIAVGHVLAMAPKITTDQADGLVHYVLAKTSGVGATGPQAVGADPGTAQ